MADQPARDVLAAALVRAGSDLDVIVPTSDLATVLAELTDTHRRADELVTKLIAIQAAWRTRKAVTDVLNRELG